MISNKGVHTYKPFKKNNFEPSLTCLFGAYATVCLLFFSDSNSHTLLFVGILAASFGSLCMLAIHGNMHQLQQWPNHLRTKGYMIKDYRAIT